MSNNCSGDEQESRTSFPAPGTTYTDEVCIPPAEYTFTITDAFGDGICCGFGSGSYKVKFQGNVVKEGSSFGSSEATTFGTCNATTETPTVVPTDSPTGAPTHNPTAAPTRNPTNAPTGTPTVPNSSVSCGGHFAATCAECPQGNGAAWCNGECVWHNDQCIHEDNIPLVNCGGHMANSCFECPQDNGASWCNGECLWQNNQCIHEDDQCKNDENWRWKNKKGIEKDCNWVAMKSEKRCKNWVKGYFLGAEGTTILSRDGCPTACNTC